MVVVYLITVLAQLPVYLVEVDNVTIQAIWLLAQIAVVLPTGFLVVGLVSPDS